MIEAIDVVIPARDEELLLPACLAAVRAAREALLRRHPAIGCRIVVVLDTCTDDSAVVARAAGVEVLEVGYRTVGRARAAGVEYVLDPLPSSAPAKAPSTPIGWHGRHWICTTDADSRVPESWLLDHLAAAEAGALVALGRVVPTPGELEPAAQDSWHLAHADPTLRHVFGANLGVRADAYLLAGGFPPRTIGEDLALVEAVEALDSLGLGLVPGAAERIVELRDSVVDTSARHHGRTPGGFAGYLRTLTDVTTPPG